MTPGGGAKRGDSPAGRHAPLGVGRRDRIGHQTGRLGPAPASKPPVSDAPVFPPPKTPRARRGNMRSTRCARDVRIGWNGPRERDHFRERRRPGAARPRRQGSRPGGGGGRPGVRRTQGALAALVGLRSAVPTPLPVERVPASRRPPMNRSGGPCRRPFRRRPAARRRGAALRTARAPASWVTRAAAPWRFRRRLHRPTSPPRHRQCSTHRAGAPDRTFGWLWAAASPESPARHYPADRGAKLTARHQAELESSEPRSRRPRATFWRKSRLDPRLPVRSLRPGQDGGARQRPLRILSTSAPRYCALRGNADALVVDQCDDRSRGSGPGRRCAGGASDLLSALHR